MMTSKRPQPRRQLVDEHVAAATLGVPVQSLRDARCRRVGVLSDLGWFRVGRRIRYDVHEMDQFIEALRARPYMRGEG